MTLVSVVTICKNDLEGIKRTVASVQRQTYDQVQHIVVDAASDDDTLEYVKTLIGQAEVISEPDDGRYDGMNKGARLADGELLWLMHAGDEFGSADSVQYVVEQYQRNPYDWGYGLARLIDHNREVIGVSGNVPFNFERFALGGRPIPHQAVVMRTDFFHEMGGYSLEFGLAEDQHFLMKCAKASTPRAWAEFLCNFDAEGAGRSRGVLPHYKDMARGREMEDVVVLKSPKVDRAVSYYFAGVAAGVGKAAAKLKH